MIHIKILNCVQIINHPKNLNMQFHFLKSFLPDNLWIHTRKLSSFHVKESMQAWQTEGFSGVEGLSLLSAKVPVLQKPSEVLVKVSAASVNPIDTAFLEGYGSKIMKIMKFIDEVSLGKCDTDQSEFPLTVGRDFVGEVVRVGQSVTKVKVNDKVWGIVMPQKQGSHAEYLVTESCNLSLKPKSLSDVEAASIPYIGLTGWSAAVISGGLTPNDCYGSQVLVIGASGGVGTFLTQLLSAWGAKVTGICSEASFEIVLSCGASEVHDYKDSETLSNLASRPRFDLIIDASGFNDEVWSSGLKEWNGASYVTLLSPLLRNTDQNGIFNGLIKSVFKLVQQNKSISMGRFCKWAYFMPNENALQEIGKLVEKGKIRPVIDKVFSMEEGMLAYKHMRDGPARGKTVIDLGSSKS